MYQEIKLCVCIPFQEIGRIYWPLLCFFKSLSQTKKQKENKENKEDKQEMWHKNLLKNAGKKNGCNVLPYFRQTVNLLAVKQKGHVKLGLVNAARGGSLMWAVALMQR